MPQEDVLSVRKAGKVSQYRAARCVEEQDQKWRRPMLCFCAMVDVFSVLSNWNISTSEDTFRLLEIFIIEI